MKILSYLTTLTALVLLMAQSAFISQEPKTKQELGKLLFFDPILSGNRRISCASCHKEQYAFADNSKVSRGVGGRKGVRNTLSVMNAGLQASFFWDGRASSLEQQALMPIVNPLEMDLHIDEAVKRLKANSLYNTAFQKLFGVRPNAVNLAAALSAFERTLEASNSPLDDWRLNKNESAVSATVKRGFALFQGKGNCMKCHSGQNFTNSEFRNIGLFDGRALIDSGRAGITKNPQDLGKFKTGSLRNVAITAPYMHNGMFKTLRQVIDYYNDPDKIIPRAIGRDPLLSQPLYLSENEKTDLENFLVSLTDKRFNLKNENL